MSIGSGRTSPFRSMAGPDRLDASDLARSMRPNAATWACGTLAIRNPEKHREGCILLSSAPPERQCAAILSLLASLVCLARVIKSSRGPRELHQSAVVRIHGCDATRPDTTCDESTRPGREDCGLASLLESRADENSTSAMPDQVSSAAQVLSFARWDRSLRRPP